MTTFLRLLGALFAVALVAAACGGSTATETADAATDNAMSEDAMSDSEMSEDAEGHDDSPADDAHDHHGANVLEVSADGAIPEVTIELTETTTPGTYDLVVSLTNFTITPDNVDGDPVDNEGHMHLLIDGEKVERFMDLERQVTVPEGDHLVEVELNANNHAAYAVDGEPIRAGQTVAGHGSAMSNDESTDDGHSHSHGDHGEAGSGIEDGLAIEDANVSRAVTLSDGAVSLDGDERIEVAVGDIVIVTISSDIAEQAHLHGYDVLVDVEPGTAATLLFTADTPGKFEIEFEKSGAFIAELVVS